MLKPEMTPDGWFIFRTAGFVKIYSAHPSLHILISSLNGCETLRYYAPVDIFSEQFIQLAGEDIILFITEIRIISNDPSSYIP